MSSNDRLSDVKIPDPPLIDDASNAAVILDSLTHDLTDYCDIQTKPLAAEFFDVDVDQPIPIVPSTKFANMIKHTVTRERRLKVRLMKVAGIDNEVLAKCMGISQGVLYKYYRSDLEVGAAECTALVAGKLMEKIRSGDTASIIFYLRTRGKWAPKNELEITHSHTIRPRSKDEIESELLRIGVPPDKLHELTE
jgi:hypothetical protein